MISQRQNGPDFERRAEVIFGQSFLEQSGHDAVVDEPAAVPLPTGPQASTHDNVSLGRDAGIGTPSEAEQALELGASALLINTAIAQAQNPAQMGRAMGLATEAGRLAYQAGRIPVKAYASASSPLTGVVNS